MCQIPGELENQPSDFVFRAQNYLARVWQILCRDLARPCLSAPELCYYGIFIQAVTFHFFRDGANVALNPALFPSLTNPLDHMIVSVLWRFVFVGTLLFLCFQLLRVYG